MGQRAAIYARVSTVDQSCERQLRDLSAFAERGGFEVVATFSETASGAKDSRRERRRVMELAQARRIDAVLVTELSRWGRSTQDLLDTLYKLAGWNVSVVAMSGMTFGARDAARSDDGDDACRHRAVRARPHQRTGEVRACGGTGPGPEARAPAWTAPGVGPPGAPGAAPGRGGSELPVDRARCRHQQEHGRRHRPTGSGERVAQQLNPWGAVGWGWSPRVFAGSRGPERLDVSATFTGARAVNPGRPWERGLRVIAAMGLPRSVPEHGIWKIVRIRIEGPVPAPLRWRTCTIRRGWLHSGPRQPIGLPPR